MPLFAPRTMPEKAWARAAALYAVGATEPAPAVPTPELLNAKIVSVHDGDTINVIAKVPGRNEYIGTADKPQPIRLLGCNAYELRATAPDGSKPGQAAQAYLAGLLPVGADVVLATIDDDKYAPRWDASVSFVYGGIVVDLVGLLIAQQYAAPWDGRGSAPLPVWPRTVPAA